LGIQKNANYIILDIKDAVTPPKPDWAQENKNMIVNSAEFDIAKVNDIVTITIEGRKGLDFLRVPIIKDWSNVRINFSSIERVQDGDIWVAYDTEYKKEATGRSIKIIAAIFGVEYINDKDLLGKAIKFFDDGLEQSEVVQKMVDEKLGKNASHDEIVETVLFNIFEREPKKSEVAYFASFLESGQYTVGRLILAGANHPKNIRKINWTELEETGIEYTPLD